MASNLTLGDPISRSEHPDQLAHHDVRHEAAALLFDRARDQRSRPLGLRDIVLDEEAHQDVGVERDHRRPAALRIASFIASTVTPRTLGLKTPQRSMTSTVSGTISTTPSSRSRKAKRSPGPSASDSRISLGRV